MIKNTAKIARKRLIRVLDRDRARCKDYSFGFRWRRDFGWPPKKV